MTQHNEAPQAPAASVEANPRANAPAQPESNASEAEPAATPEAPASDAPSRASDQPAPAAVADQEASPPPAEAPAGTGAEPPAPADATAAAAGESDKEGSAKKKRRRRKKKPGQKAAAEGTAPATGGEAEREGKPAKDSGGGVFMRFFEGAAQGKRHAFAAGEVVAGRVVRINEGAFVVDLFGKAKAFVDAFEPHEVPIMPEPEPASQPEPATVAEAAGAPPTDAKTSQAEAGAMEAGPTTQPNQGQVAAPAEQALAAAEPAQPNQGQVAAPAEQALAAAEPAQRTTAVGLNEATPSAPGTSVSVDAPTPPAEPSPQAAPESSQAGEPAPEGEAAVVAKQSVSAGPSAEPAVSEQRAPPEPGTAAEASPQAAPGSAPESAAAPEGREEEQHAEEAAEPEPEPPPPPELGTIFKGRIGFVSESGHVVLVNRIIDVAAAKARVAAARERRQRVRGLVFGFNRGGFDVLVEGLRVFCPASGMALAAIENPEEFLGQRLEFTVPPSKAGSHGFVVSRRGILERQQRKAAKQLLRTLTPGQRIKGRVTQVRDFGLFVDLGGIEGLVHQSELAYARGVRPADVASVGDEVEVQVLKVGEGQTRRERERVSLSLKALQQDPWTAHAQLLEPGTVHTGKVVRTTEFGAFVELAPQIEGLLHISELGRELKHANQVVEEGSQIKVVVERVDARTRRISLSKLSQAEESALEAGTDPRSVRPPKPGQQVKVVVDKIEHAGLFVQVPGVFGRRGRGFIPNSEMGTERGADHRRTFPPGTEIPVKAIGVDRDGGLRFSRKALLVEEEKRAVQDYRREVARQGLGTFGDLLRAKLEGGKGR